MRQLPHGSTGQVLNIVDEIYQPSCDGRREKKALEERSVKTLFAERRLGWPNQDLQKQTESSTQLAKRVSLELKFAGWVTLYAGMSTFPSLKSESWGVLNFQHAAEFRNSKST